ncbi:MAG: DUF1800 domain-containing protein, partial [Gammaproteobacteria bacterium]|nr:DUF1800 domain-containing protein [Gammaproteobacteria bacterium]
KSKDWDETHVRRVLRAFAYGGLTTDAQIENWAGMKPAQAIAQMLTFEVNNERLSPSEDQNSAYCGSLADLQALWSSDDPDNRMTWPDRYRYDTLGGNLQLSQTNLQRTWSKAVSTRGCNPFLHKMALFLTNYHASIHVRNTRAALIRDYYDDYVSALASGQDFIEVMTVGASHAAVARAYRHQDNSFRNGTFYGNEDFAREYLQLFFGVLGTTEDPDYYETVSIKNNALALTGMNLDKETDAYGSTSSGDWYVSPIVFTDHVDDTGRTIRNQSWHYQNELGAGSCVEILHADICGATADEKLQALGQVAGNHPESLDNIPVKLVGFFADDNLDAGKMDELRGSWVEADFDLLAFVQKYAVSTAFHHASTFKYLTAFDRNLIAQNAATLTNEENFAKPHYHAPYDRMRFQGVEVFEPIRNVFGHQTGVDAANNPYIFKNAYYQNAQQNFYHVTSQGTYTLADGGPSYLWQKDWGAVIPLDGDGQHGVAAVSDWLWNRFIGDGGKNFDLIAKAQVQSLLATGRDFGFEVDPDNRDPELFYSSADIGGDHAAAAARFAEHGAAVLDLSTVEGNERVGMAVNFITMTPYAFAMEGQ